MKINIFFLKLQEQTQKRRGWISQKKEKLLLLTPEIIGDMKLIRRQLKHHQFRIRSEIFILLEIILNTFHCWQYHFRLKSLFWLKYHFFYCGLYPLSIYYAARCVHFTVPSGRRGTFFFLWEQMYTSGCTFIKKIKPFVSHYISMPW